MINHETHTHILLNNVAHSQALCPGLGGFLSARSAATAPRNVCVASFQGLVWRPKSMHRLAGLFFPPLGHGLCANIPLDSRQQLPIIHWLVEITFYRPHHLLNSLK